MASTSTGPCISAQPECQPYLIPSSSKHRPRASKDRHALYHFWNHMCLFTELLSTAQELELWQVAVLALPSVTMQRKRLALWLWYPRENAHFHNDHSRVKLSDTYNRTTRTLASHGSTQRTLLDPPDTDRWSRLTSHKSHKSTSLHIFHLPSHNPDISSAHSWHRQRLLFPSQWLGLTIRRSRRLCGSWRNGINVRAF